MRVSTIIGESSTLIAVDAKSLESTATDQNEPIKQMRVGGASRARPAAGRPHPILSDA